MGLVGGRRHPARPIIAGDLGKDTCPRTPNTRVIQRGSGVVCERRKLGVVLARGFPWIGSRSDLSFALRTTVQSGWTLERIQAPKR